MISKNGANITRESYLKKMAQKMAKLAPGQRPENRHRKNNRR